MQRRTSAGISRLAVGRQHDERILDAPVGGIGDVRDAREGIEADVVVARVPLEQTTRALAQLHDAFELARERLARRGAPRCSSSPTLRSRSASAASRRRSTSFSR